MFNRIKGVLSNQRGMETIEVIGIGVVALIVVALLFNATKAGFNNTTNKIGTGINTLNSTGVNSTGSLNP